MDKYFQGLQIILFQGGDAIHRTTIKTASHMYGTELPNLGKLLKAGARVIKPGSLMFLLCSQNYQICPPNVKRIGIITMTIVPNNELRACNIYEKLY